MILNILANLMNSAASSSSRVICSGKQHVSRQFPKLLYGFIKSICVFDTNGIDQLRPTFDRLCFEFLPSVLKPLERRIKGSGVK